MVWAFKAFFKLLGRIFVILISIPLSILILPFYGIYSLLGGKTKTRVAVSKKKDKSSWVDRYEEIIAFMDDE